MYITVIVEVKRPMGQAHGIKEDIAMFLERYGDARVVDIRKDKPEQISISLR